MKEILFFIFFIAFFQIASVAQTDGVQFEEKEVFKNDEIEIRQIDEHTWAGIGHLTYNESLYLVEGNEKAVLIDAGTKIMDLDKILASITTKPVMLVATHVHPDHTGSAIAYFPEIFINPADTTLIPFMMRNYAGIVKYLEDGEIIDLGGRKLEVVFTPAHTAGSTTFIDQEAGYGFSGDSFGSGNLILSLDFSTLIATCEKTSAIMEKYGIKYFYPGHYYGKNAETKQRVDDLITLSKDVLSGKVKGEAAGMMGLVVSDYGVRINYNKKAIK